MGEQLNIDGLQISVKPVNGEDYISLTDMAKARITDSANSEPRIIIRNWLRLGATLNFIGIWEGLNNPAFKQVEFDRVYRSRIGDNTFTPSATQLLKDTDCIGFVVKSGRYGGTWAHKDIAFSFGSWISPEFQYFLIKDYQRLRNVEAQLLGKAWDTGRFFSKINYDLHTKSIEENLAPRANEKESPFLYSSEADLLNMAVFQMTAKQWREANPDLKGNIRDNASLVEIVVLANMESINSMLISAGASKEARYLRLAEEAAKQIEILSKDKRLSSGKKFLK